MIRFMRKKLLSISLFFVVSMFMTSCIDDLFPIGVSGRTYTGFQHFVYKECEEDGVEINTISFQSESVGGVWTTEYISMIDTIKTMVCFDYSFVNPYGEISIDDVEDTERYDEWYSFFYNMKERTLTLYSPDNDTLRLYLNE